jgi:glucose uptake protein
MGNSRGARFYSAQLAMVVNALIGVYWLKDPQPKTRAATLTRVGCGLAMIGGACWGI